jgi:hypothetical protein
MQVVISRPLTAGPWAARDPLCPEDLMLGRARAGMLVVQFETGQQLVKRFRDVQEAKEVLGQVGQRGVPIPSEAKEVVQVQEGCKGGGCCLEEG